MSLTKGQEYVLNGAIQRIMGTTVREIEELSPLEDNFSHWCPEFRYGEAVVVIGNIMIVMSVGECDYQTFKMVYYEKTLKLLYNHGILRQTLEAAML